MTSGRTFRARGVAEQRLCWVRLKAMSKDKTYNEPSEVEAKDGEVLVDGPDGIDVKLTPGAAIETSDRLLAAGAEAHGQQLRKEE